MASVRGGRLWGIMHACMHVSFPERVGVAQEGGMLMTNLLTTTSRPEGSGVELNWCDTHMPRPPATHTPSPTPWDASTPSPLLPPPRPPPPPHDAIM
eukprot:247251-Chlamydomonas_euryale.AAC.7